MLITLWMEEELDAERLSNLPRATQHPRGSAGLKLGILTPKPSSSWHDPAAQAREKRHLQGLMGERPKSSWGKILRKQPLAAESQPAPRQEGPAAGRWGGGEREGGG